jgi:hypothetical protein
MEGADAEQFASMQTHASPSIHDGWEVVNPVFESLSKRQLVKVTAFTFSLL